MAIRASNGADEELGREAVEVARRSEVEAEAPRRSPAERPLEVPVDWIWEAE